MQFAVSQVAVLVTQTLGLGLGLADLWFTDFLPRPFSWI